jgi:hypothetical protein
MLSRSWALTVAIGASLAALPAAAHAQDKDAFRAETRMAAAKLRSAGEPKDRCFIGGVVGEGAIVTRIVSPTSLMPGDKLVALNGVALSGKSVDDIVVQLRGIDPAAVVPVRVERGGKALDLQVSCSNARPVMTALLEGLDQAAAGKFDDCVTALSQRQDLGTYGVMIKAQCASLSKASKGYNLPQLAYDAMRMMLEDAQWVAAPRTELIGRLHASEAFITQGLGEARYRELVDITKRWPGGQGAYESGAPDWALFRRNAEAALREKLIDPESGRIEWPYGFTYGTWKPLLGKRVDGYWSCGLINARNRMGGYTGSTYFVVVLDRNGLVQYSDMGTAQDFDIISTQCSKSVKLLPAAPPELAGSSTGSSSAPSVSIADELKKLADLRASGAITETEFQAAKQKLLGTPQR